MGKHGQGDEEGLGEAGLVDFAGHQEEGLGVRYGAVDERENGGVGDVQAGEEAEGVGGVSLYAGYCCLFATLVQI